MTKKNFYLFTVVILTILTTCLHFVFMQTISPHVIFEELYYLPLLIGVLLFGVRGAVVTWLFVSIAYIPFFFAPWTTSIQGYADRTLHLVLTGVIALVVGILVERERKKSKEVEQERFLAGVGKVATVIVHDLKNPLISILGFTKRICEGKGDSTQAVQAITESARAMQRIVDDVLDFAKPIQLDLKDCNLVESIIRSVDECRTKASEQEVTLLVNVPVENITVTIDNFHFERALVNLIDNSIDASRQGGEVVISAKMSSNELVVSITDHGSGMSREAVAHAFELFYTTKTNGTGLGMPIVKKIIEEHGGKLAIKSRKGVGTEVAVRLPKS